MRVRYGTTPDGRIVKKADLYTADEHRIGPEHVDPDARRIIDRLRRAGHKAYIVGGAVRDLLRGIDPKDFDIATDATPRQLRRIFPNSRQIGRRFRIVHIYVNRGGERKIFEVTTFRARANEEGANSYGSLEEDVWRRDFTLNALYYCPLEGIVIDFVGGYRDIQEGKLRTPVPTEASFLEDPVRMIRGIKYAEIVGFELPKPMAALIRKHHRELASCSAARLTEEAYKILASGCSAPIFLSAYRLRLLESFLPALDQFLSQFGRKGAEGRIASSLQALDQRIRERGAERINRAHMLSYLFRDMAEDWKRGLASEEAAEILVEKLRQAALPLQPSRKEMELAARRYLRPGRRRP